jgi:glycosyltransferase involved in cell wall biosynthesis
MHHVDSMTATPSALRIAVVSETYHPEVNGVAVTLKQLVDRLRERQHEVQLVRPRQPDVDRTTRREGDDELLLRGMPIPRYPELKMGLPSTSALIDAWQRRRPQLVHIATPGPLGWSALRAAQRLQLPVCSDFRTNFHAYSRHYRLAWLYRPIVGYLRVLHNRTAFTMVPTDALRRELDALGFERLVTVARGVDTTLFDPSRRSAALRASWAAGDDTPVVLFVGRLASEKNLGALVAAYRAMRALRPATRLVIVGDGPARAELLAAVPDAVHAGKRSGVELAMHYASADVFVFPSMTETFGNVTPEAMASGLAVVAYDHAAAGQLIRDDQDGLLAPLGDEADFVARAARLAASPADVRRLGAQARLTANDHGWGRIVTQVESVFGATIASASAVPAFGIAPQARPA